MVMTRSTPPLRRSAPTDHGSPSVWLPTGARRALCSPERPVDRRCKKDIYASVESACRNDAGDYYEYPLCMTAHCMAVNMTKVKEVGADQYIDTDKHTWSTDGFLKTVDALYNGGYENVAAIYCSGQGGDQAPAPSSTTCTAAPSPMLSTPSTPLTPPRTSRPSSSVRCQGREF